MIYQNIPPRVLSNDLIKKIFFKYFDQYYFRLKDSAKNVSMLLPALSFNGLRIVVKRLTLPKKFYLHYLEV